MEVKHTDTRKTPPSISVIMAVKDGADYLEDALDSLSAQTYDNWEAIIVDDGSMDATAKILKSHQSRDARFILVANQQSMGLAASLNRALKSASGVFIARMDADDIALPNRFETQYNWLNNNPDHVLLGSNAILISADNQYLGCTDKANTDEQIRLNMLFENPFCHPTVMWRCQKNTNNSIVYDESFDTTQDWDLWLKFLEYGKVANLKTALLKQRVHQGSISAQKKDRQRLNSLRIQHQYFTQVFEEKEWDAKFFHDVNNIFMGDRNHIPTGDKSRAEIAIEVLALASEMQKKLNATREATLYLFLDRAIRTGLYPPFATGWFKLFRAVCQHPFLAAKFLKRNLALWEKTRISVKYE